MFGKALDAESKGLSDFIDEFVMLGNEHGMMLPTILLLSGPN